MNDLEKLLVSELRDIYDGEQRLVDGLAQMESVAESAPLKAAFREHREQTKIHIQRLEEILHQLGEPAKRKSCFGIEGILHEARRMIDENSGHSTLEAALIICGQKAEHYEIAAYGSLCSWAKELGQDDALQMLKENLKEEKQTSERLSRLAEAPPAATDDLEKLFNKQLREMNDAEHMLAQGLAELEYYATSKPLKLALGYHLKQTEKHSKRLEKVFSKIGSSPDRRACDGIEGIIDEAQVAVEEFLGNSALDAALIAAGQKAEHYEMATYTALCSWASELGHKDSVSLLEGNLKEERRADQALTLLAELSRNPEAARHDGPKKTGEEAEFMKAITHGP